MSEVFEIFEPGLRHLREERDRKRNEIQIPASGAPPFGIDLEAGVAYIEAGDQADHQSADRADHQSDARADDQPTAP